MRRRRAARTTGALIALTLLLSGCDWVDELRRSDFAKQDVDAITAASAQAMKVVESVRVIGTVDAGGTHMLIDLRVSEDQCTGFTRLGRGLVDVRRTPDGFWVRADRQALTDQGVSSVHPGLGRVANKWVKSEVIPLCRLDYWLDPFSTSTAEDREAARGKGKDKKSDAGDDLDAGKEHTVGKESDVDGTRAVAIVQSQPGVEAEPTTWVASEAPHRVVRVEGSTPDVTMRVDFGEYDREFTVETPAAKDTYRR